MKIRFLFPILVVLAIVHAAPCQNLSPKFSLAIELKESVLKRGSFVNLIVTTKNICSHDISVGKIVGSAESAFEIFVRQHGR